MRAFIIVSASNKAKLTADSSFTYNQNTRNVKFRQALVASTPRGQAGWIVPGFCVLGEC